jgi:hypothetical protein
MKRRTWKSVRTQVSSEISRDAIVSVDRSYREDITEGRKLGDDAIQETRRTPIDEGFSPPANLCA